MSGVGRVCRLGDQLEGYCNSLSKADEDISLEHEEMRGMVTIMEMGFTRFGHESNVREENRELKRS